MQNLLAKSTADVLSTLVYPGDPKSQDLLLTIFNNDLHAAFLDFCPFSYVVFSEDKVTSMDRPDTQIDENFALYIKLQTPRATPLLLTLLRDQDARVAAYAAIILGQIADPATADALLRVLEHGATDNYTDYAGAGLRHAAAYALGQLKTDAVRQQLLATLRSENWRACAGAAEALGVMGDCQAIDQLLPLLRNPQPQVRTAAAQALGMLGATDAIAELQQLAHDPYLNVRVTAAKALNCLAAR